MINDNVFITNIVIWNNGELEIKKTDVRKDFKVSVYNNSKILDYKIVDQTNPDVANFRILAKNNELVIDWDYFDPKFGFELQIIYSGIAESEIKVDGYVLGKEIKKVTPRKVRDLLRNLIFVFLVILFIPTSFFLYRFYKDSPTTFRFILFVVWVLYGIFISFYFFLPYFTGIELPVFNH